MAKTPMPPKERVLTGSTLALGDVGAQLPLAVALQAVEGDGGGGDVPLQGAPGEVGLGALGLQQAVLDQLILHRPVGAQLAAGGCCRSGSP